MKRALLLVVVLVAGFAGGYWFRRGASTPAAGEKGGRKILYWHDPMHPAYRSDKPGIAPDCGMRLEPVYADAGPAEEKKEGKILHYRDPGNPQYTSDKPGLNPETGNELEPVYEGDPPPGAVQISAEKQQLIGVKYGQAEFADGGQTIRAVGRVTVDETRIARVHTRVEGWIEKVLVEFIGQVVEKGQPLLTLYSPEMLATQQEYLLALKARDILKGSPVRGLQEDNASLVEVARRRLELWGLSGAQVEEVARTGKPMTNITVHSPVAGYVTARNAFLKQKITPETELYTIVDLSRVWIMADVFESEAGMVKLGQAASFSVPSLAGRRFQARVSYIQPQVEAATRTLKVRLETDNPGGVFKPEMFVNVDLVVGGARRLVVPVNAVLNSGVRQTVFVDRGNGYLEPRQVHIGQRLGDRVEILHGLKPGERIAISGVFLIDSESQLKAAASSMGSGPAPEAPAPGPPAGGHQH